MKRNKLAAVTLAAAALAVTFAARGDAPRLEIKGVRIGMTRAEVTAALGSLNPKGVVIGGVPSYFNDMGSDAGLGLGFQEDHLEHFLFIFRSTGFPQLLLAFMEKYPALSCDDSEVRNRVGGVFTQTTCSASDDLGTLVLSRFGKDLNTGYLSMIASAAVQRTGDANAKKRKDI